MIKIIWNAFLLAIIALSAAWLSNNAGRIEINWIGYRVETSVAVVLSLVVICYAVFYVFLAKPCLLIRQKISFWLNADKRANKIAKSKIEKETQKQALLSKGLIALISGDLNQAEKSLKQVKKEFEEDDYQALLFSAQFAEEKNDIGSALHLYTKLSKKKETRLCAMRANVRLYTLSGNFAKALELCTLLLEEKNPPSWVLSQAFELQVKQGKTKDALVTLQRALKQNLFDKLTAKRLKASVLLEEAEQTLDEKEKENLIRQAYQTDETFVRAGVQMAGLYIGLKEEKKAKRLLQKLWKLSPSWDVYALYLSLMQEKPPIEIVREVEEMTKENTQTPLNHLVFADASLKAKLWGQAKSAVDKYLDLRPQSRRALIIAIKIAEYHQETDKAEEYRLRASKAPVEWAYFCDTCFANFEKDNTTCPACHTLGSIHLVE